MKKTFIVVVSLLCISISGLSWASADESPHVWQFEIAPLYLWAISIDGDIGVRGRTTSASVGFDDIYDNLEGVFTARIRALYNEQIQIFFDYNYLDLGTEQSTGPVTLGVGFESQFINVGAGYRLTEGPHILFLNAGARYVELDAEISLVQQGISLSGDESWVDPIIGMDYSYAINDQWGLRMLGDIGGFGVSSDFTWQAGLMFQYQPWKHVAIIAGYRAIGTDYESDNEYGKVTFDTIIHGPVLGLDFRF